MNDKLASVNRARVPSHLHTITSFDGTTIAYQHIRKGKECVMFLHGLTGDLAAWEPMAKTFNKKGYSTIAIDIRGHGHSDRLSHKDKITLRHAARDIEAILKKEGIKKIHLIGHCFGALIALIFTEKNPKQVASLTLLSPLPSDTKRNIPQRMGILSSKVFYTLIFPFIKNGRHGHNNWERFISMNDPDLYKYTLLGRNPGRRTCVCFLNDISRFEFTGKRSKHHTLIVHGTRDILVGDGSSKRFHTLLPEAKLILIGGARHHLPIHNTKMIGDIILTFIGERKATRTNKKKKRTPRT